MSLSLEYLERCAAETGFQVGALEKVVRLGELAGDISRHPFLGPTLILKGGTALNLGFGLPKRLSVDLDYNYIGQSEREAMLRERPKIENAVAELARRHGYLVQKSADAFAGRKYYLRYRSVLGPQDRIELDLNYLFRVPLSETESRELWQPGDLDRPRAVLVGMEELLIGKLLAFFERGAARDVWDLAHLPGPASIVMESSRLRAWFITFSVILEHPLTTYNRSRLEHLVTDRIVSEQLAPLLALDVIPKADGLIKKAWAIAKNFLNPDADEKEYLDSVQKGDIHLELLFPSEPQEALRIAEHPAIRWKMVNVRAHLKTKIRTQKGNDSRRGPRKG